MQFRTKVGETVYTIIRSAMESSIGAGIATASQPITAPLKEAIDDVLTTLQIFEHKKFISSFTFDSEDASDEQFARETFAVKAPISFQITINEPATLLSGRPNSGHFFPSRNYWKLSCCGPEKAWLLE